ncbi:DegT/DnrJ/EryC1/StrS family aminotransferase [Desulfotignum phosphitoxidans]|uniref:Uridine 5'-(Beta-1-threo-pentapyranosyl-4-ulose diphosphate) aminotransferase StsC n=1 Tax=Desulfotignum phosphitoxidans DSM 13687 TaxID=1286635 RepID=S0G0B3_9BACT|nr:DegT/DnrJ/EryC1/StrS family aminotransferase [Desulfotignum phosphitoxidans]EMS77652.1 uridine 5'-(beta-1-threo-pentapyranosyl-4-ulose diphosphate) aminotransferase StsC [Desulfotignum phosphitoxidans DSM 13687]
MDIRLFKPSVGKEELENLKAVFDRAWLGLGPMVSQFEDEWCRYIGCKISIGVNSATAALHLALTAFQFPAGKKVLVPAITFTSTASVVLYNRLTPVFVDVDPDTTVMDMDDLRSKIDPDCVAVIPVHNAGYPVPMNELMALADQHHLKVIEDCAHCAGGSYKGKKLGTWGHIGCFSFEEKKCMTTGDGGMICSDDPELIEPLRAYRWVGIDKDTWRRAESAKGRQENEALHWHYEISVLGYKYNMNDIMAAIGLAQLKKLDAMNARRRAIIGKYLDGIKDIPAISPYTKYSIEGHEAYWFFGIRCKQRDEMIIHLKNNGIATGVHFYPLPLHPLFKPYDNGCPMAKNIWKTFITLPSHVDLKDDEIAYVIENLQGFFK